MYSPPKGQARVHEHSVLHIGPSRVAWLTRGGDPVVHQMEFDGEVLKPHQAALELLARSKERRRTCILGLGEGIYQRRQVDLPADLGGRELRDILRRKAAGILGVESQVVFQALPLGGDRQRKRDGVQSWLVFAIEAKRLRSLLKELMAAGFRIVRTVATEVAYQGMAPVEGLQEGQAAIVIGHLESAVGISLVTGAGLVTQNLVPTGALDRESMASTLVQELRAMDAFWRKMNEGGAVTRATFIGFDEAWADTIAPSAQLILPQVELAFDKEARQSSCGFGSCVRALSACRAQSELSIEFTLSVPPKRRVAVMLSAASLAVVVSLGGMASDAVAQRADSLRGDLRQRFERERVRTELADVKARLEEHEAAAENYAAEWSAIIGTGTSSVPFSDLAGSILSALGADAALESFKLEPNESGAEFVAIAVTPADALRSAGAMRDAFARLEASGFFTDLSLEPETRVPTKEDQAQLLRFSMKGNWVPPGLARGQEEHQGGAL